MSPFATDAFAQAAGAAPANSMFQFIPLILVFFVFYLLIIRPQQKKQKQHQVMLDNLKKGDRVVTTGGIFATVIKLGEDRITVEIADKVRVQLERQQVTRLEKESSKKEKQESSDSEKAKTTEDSSVTNSEAK